MSVGRIIEITQHMLALAYRLRSVALDPYLSHNTMSQLEDECQQLLDALRRESARGEREA